MIKKILSILIAVIMAFSVAQVAFAAEKFYDDEYECWLYKENGFIYELNEEEDYLWIKEYVGTGDTICIPKTLGGMSVNYWNIDAYMFADSNASAFSVDEDNESFSVKDGVLFSKDGSELIAYPNGKAGDSYDIPEGVERLCTGCFYYSSLKEVTFPSTLKHASTDCFGDSFGDFVSSTDGLFYAGNILIDYSRIYFFVIYEIINKADVLIVIKEGTEKILSGALPKVNSFIIIPDTVTDMGDYQICNYLCGSEGSAAQKFAEENDINFMIMGEGHEHAYLRSVTAVPTCVSEGRVDYICPCGDVKYSVTLEADTENGHSFVENKKGQYVCEYCGASDESRCGCKCHSLGMISDSFFGFISELFFRIKLVFWHLTGTHQYCECGCRHY